MEIEFKGGNCVTVTVKKDVLVTDAKLSAIGLKDQAEKALVQLATREEFVAPAGENTVTITGPGEYEVSTFSIKGVAAQSHLDAKDQPKRATMYRVDTGDFKLAIVGHIAPDLDETQLEDLGMVDILVVPVGGNGYTLDPHAAVELTRKIDPKLVIPTHYDEDGVSYEVPQLELELFLKELGATAQESTPKLKLKPGMLGDVLSVCVLTRTK